MNHLGTSLGSDVPRLLPRCGRLVGGARIEWAAGYVFRSFGVHVAVRANRYAVIEACKALFPPGWKAVASSTIDRSYALLVTKPSRAAYPLGRVCESRKAASTASSTSVRNSVTS